MARISVVMGRLVGVVKACQRVEVRPLARAQPEDRRFDLAPVLEDPLALLFSEKSSRHPP
jgi:hypothetical protein